MKTEYEKEMFGKLEEIRKKMIGLIRFEDSPKYIELKRQEQVIRKEIMKYKTEKAYEKLRKKEF